MDILQLVSGYGAAICIPLAFLPQTISIIKTRKTSGLSIISYLIYQIGGISFLISGIYLHQIPVIICQTITGFLNFIIISIIIGNLCTKKSLRNDNFNKELKND